MNKFWDWLKPKLVWILAGAGVVLAGVVALLTFGRVRPKFGKPPARPELKKVEEVEAPKVDTTFETDLDANPKDDFDKEKKKPLTGQEKLLENLNERFRG